MRHWRPGRYLALRLTAMFAGCATVVFLLAGLALIVWALPRLAERCGLDPGLALWLGAANPLVLFHMVSGIHNEALMLGLMLAGTEFALRGISAFPSGAAVGAAERHR